MNQQVSTTGQCDLKALLIEAKQKVPPMLTTLDSLSDDLIQLGGERES